MHSKTILFQSMTAFMLLCVAPACSSNDDNDLAPSVTSNSPVLDAVGVPINAGIVANFSEPMDPDTLDETTFTVTVGLASVPVDGSVIYSDSSATFWPAEHLNAGDTYTATVTTGAESAVSGKSLFKDHAWSFETGDSLEPGIAVNLRSAGNFAILAKSGISTVPDSIILGDIGVSPSAATAITEFALTLDASGTFSTSAQVTGNVYAADYAPPTPEDMTTAVLDMETAFSDAAARAPDVTELGAGSINTATTLVPGVYKWGTSLLINADVTLAGSATDVWVFQIAQDLIVASGTLVGLSSGALPENVFWQVSGLVDLDTTATVNGVILTATAITLRTGATVNGRLLAQTMVSLDHASVTEPAP